MTEHSDDSAFEPVLDGFPTEIDPRHVRSRDHLEVLATEFSERGRRGENPSIDTYIERYPDLAEGIRELFPIVAALEQWKSDRESELLRDHLPDQFNIQQLGDCRIVREIGRGGMGVVFEGLQGALERRVAVKLLPWRISMVPGRQERFEQEARTIAKLGHANIVPIYSFGRHDDYAYYVMQYIESVGLNRIIERLAETQLLWFSQEIAAARERPADAPAGQGQGGIRHDSWKMLARMVLQVAQALRHAHGQGVLHNDVKPANLLIDAAGRVWVTDFGLAQEIDPEADPNDDRVTGTLRYMAPERFHGICSAASDIYSLGVTLFELLTRVPAFPADDRTSLVEQISKGQLQRPRDVNREIPAGLDAIVRKATQREPVRRYHSSAQLADDLQRFVNGKAVQARREQGLFGWLRRGK